MDAKEAFSRNKKHIKLSPCPFCGKRPVILITDAEGNLKKEFYLVNVWSGLAFAISHPNKDCPIGTDEDERYRFLYDTRDEAIEDWNKRRC